MMLFKLSFKNIRRSIRDYAVYFFTLIIGVSIFYVFNAIGTQIAFLRLESDMREITELLMSMISALSVFVAGVLGLLIVYASRFLMKRRNREFAVYMTLGMGKGQISRILIMETLFIGMGSLAAGLFLGMGLSQFMSALVANLFEADMTAYKFTVSGEAVIKTILYFAIIYAVAMIFNSITVTHLKLIQLLQSGKRSEQIRLKNSAVCIFLFLIAVWGLFYSYYQVGWKFENLTRGNIFLYIAIGAVSTFLFFWSVSGLLVRVFMSFKNIYYRGLNVFSFRQISSKINTMVMSMTMICLMLFVTICTLSAGFSIRNSMRANIASQCPADLEITMHFEEASAGISLQKAAKECGFDITSCLKENVEYFIYSDPFFRWTDFLGDALDQESRYVFQWDTPEELISVSDYNAVMRLYGKETVSLAEGEYLLVCDFGSMKEIRDLALSQKKEIDVFGYKLHSKTEECAEGFLELSAQHINPGFFVVPDSVLEGAAYKESRIVGNYDASDNGEKRAVEKMVRMGYSEKLLTRFGKVYPDIRASFGINTRLDIAQAAVGLGAMVTFLGLYIGMVFLIACGAVLALKELSESVDSMGRYEILRKIGAEEGDLQKSLFVQTGIFFLLPLLLAAIHSVFGMKFALNILEMFATEGLVESILSTTAIVLVIYGGYFLLTYLGSKRIVRNFWL